MLEYLLGLGASPEELVEFRDELPVAASMASLRSGVERLTLRDVAARCALPYDDVVQFWRVLGLPHAGPDDPVASERTVELISLFRMGVDVFGRDIGMQLARTVGETMARLADAFVSAFIVAVGAPASRRDPSLLELAQENARASQLVEPLAGAFDTLLRHHLEMARRPMAAVLPDEIATYETRELAIGFADLTGSTALAARVSFTELGRALGDFESIASDLVNLGGGRVVKLIGDEVMFSAPSVRAGCDIACGLIDAVAQHGGLPPVRAGIAAGPVLVRYGDCFGPVVNLAARLVAQAAPGTVIAPAAVAVDLADGGAFRSEGLGAVELRGFDEPVDVVVVTRA